MPSIGNVTLDALNVSNDGFAPQGIETEELERPGANGVTYRQIGRRPNPAEYESVHGYTSVSNRQAGKVAYLNLKGRAVSLVDDHGASATVIVRDVRILSERKAELVVGYSGEHLMTAKWTVEPL